MTEYKTIKVPTDKFDQLKAEKPDGATWGYYLTELRTVDRSESEG